MRTLVIFYRVLTALLLLAFTGTLVAILWWPEEYARLIGTAVVLMIAAATCGVQGDDEAKRCPELRRRVIR